jgi:hypothetical protein
MYFMTRDAYGICERRDVLIPVSMSFKVFMDDRFSGFVIGGILVFIVCPSIYLR